MTAKNISIEFPGVLALDRVNFTIHSGEIRAVVGTNGAGKSTLMKVLSGVYPSWSGEICVNGKSVELRTPAEALKLGIGIVHQEVDSAILPDFTVFENLLMDDVASDNHMIYRRKALRRQAEAILKELGIELWPGMLAKNLTLAQKQLLLIAKEVHKKCRLLILDEPTASLSMAETQKLFQFIRRLAKEEHTAVVFISHRIGEILSVCESCSVMRFGRITDEFPVTEHTRTEKIVEKMLGRVADGREDTFGEHSDIRENPVMLEVSGLCDQKNSLKQVSFYVRKGEIVGLAGLVGAGKTEICKTVFGAEKKSAGVIKINGKEVFLKNPTDAVRHRIALVPEERRKEGICPSESIAFHLCVACLAKFCTCSILHKTAMGARARAAIEELLVSCRDEKQQIQFLSGGNQQKVIIGKWIEADCDIYILDEPMQGIDVGAKQEIFRMIKSLAKKGAAVLYVSSDISELLAITDRLYTLYNGQITAERKTAETEEQEIMYDMIGGNHG